MNFEKTLNELENSLEILFNQKYKGYTKEAKKDIKEFLAISKEKLKRWTILLKNGNLTLEDFEWLITSQKNLFHLKALQGVGISKISLGHFKNKITETIISFISKAIFI